MADVDSLEIKIQSDAKSANSEIDKIIDRLGGISKALSRISTTSITSAFKEISNALGKIDTKIFSKVSDSAKSAEKEIKKVTSSTKSISKAKISFDASDYQSVIRELSTKFSNVGSEFKVSGTLSEMEKQADSLSKRLETLTQKEEKIISIGQNAPDSKMFTNLQYDIAETVNKLDKLGDAIASAKTKASDMSNLKINRWTDNIDVSKGTERLPKVSQISPSSIGFNPDLMATLYGESARGIKNYEQFAKQFGNTAKSAFSSFSNEAEVLKEKTASLGNKLEELREKLKTMKAQGLNFGDAKFDKTYVELNKAEAELKEYKASLNSAGKESKNFSGISVPSFQKVTNEIRRMGSGITSSLKNIANIGNAFRSTSAHSFSLAKSIGKLYIGFQSLRGIGNLLGKSIDLSSNLTEVQNVVDTAFGKYKKSIEDFSKVSIPEFGMSELTAKTIAGRFQSMGVSLGYSQKQMSGMSVELTKLAADMASFYNVSQEDVAKSLESVFTGTTMPLRKYGLDLTNATLEEWAHKQGIDAKIKSMSQAEKVMLRYQYVMANTGAAQGDFARTADTWANQVRVLGQNFQVLGSIVGGVLINALKPFVKGINIIMSQVIDFASTISNALGKIFGWTYEEGGGATNPAEDLAEGMGDVADETDKAAKKQKEFNKQLGKIDELQNFTTSKNKDTDKDGSGDISGLGDATYGGQWKQGKSIIKAFESDIDTLYKLGQKISDALSDTMESIEWDKVYKKAKDFGKGLAKFLNGLFTGSKGKRLFKNLGKTIANAINTSMYAVLDFATEFKWESLGENLAEGINSFFKNWDAGLTAKTFNKFTGGILDVMIKAVQTVKWKEITQKIADLISGIDAKGISWKLGKLANSLANAFYQLVSNKDTWVNLGQKIADGINGLFKGMNDIDKETGLTGWQALGKSISDTILGFGETITTALNAVDWEMVGQSIADFIASIKFTKVTWNLINVANSAFNAIVDAIDGFVEKAPLESAIVGLFTGLTLTGVTKKIAAAITKALAKRNLTLGKVAIGIGLGTASIKLANKGKWTSSITAGITAFMAAKTFGASTNLSLKIAGVVVAAASGFTLGKKIGEWIQDEMGSDEMKQYRYDFAFTDLFDIDAEEWWQGLSDLLVDYGLDEKFEDAFDFLIPFHAGFPSWSEFKDGLKLWWDDIKEKIKNKAKKMAIDIGVKVATKAADVALKIDKLLGHVPSKAVSFELKVGSKVSDIKESVQKKVTSAVAKVKGTVKLGFEFAKSAANAVINFINKVFIKNLNKINFKFPEFEIFGKKIGGWKFGFDVPEIKTFAQGGFPEDGWFRAKKGEYLGRFDDGTSYVANNKQIENGIAVEVSGAVRNANMEQNMLLREQNSLLRAILEKDTGISASSVFNAVRQENNVFKKRTGQSALI